MIDVKDIYARDYITGEPIPLSNILLEMERRIEALEEENVATTNNLLELAYDYDMLRTESDASWLNPEDRVDI